MSFFLLITACVVQTSATSFWDQSSDHVPFWVTILGQIIVGGIIIGLIQRLFNNNLEKYKSLLSHSSQFQLSWKNAEREALVGLYIKIFDHYNFITGQMEDAFMYDSYKEMILRISSINEVTSEKNKACRYYSLFGTDDEKIKALVDTYNMLSGIYIGELGKFMFEKFEDQRKILPNGLPIYKIPYDDIDWNKLAKFKSGIIGFIDKKTKPFMIRIEPILEELSVEIRNKIKSIEF